MCCFRIYYVHCNVYINCLVHRIYYVHCKVYINCVVTHLCPFSKSKLNEEAWSLTASTLLHRLVLSIELCTVQTGTGKVDPDRKFKCTTSARVVNRIYYVHCKVYINCVVHRIYCVHCKVYINCLVHRIYYVNCKVYINCVVAPLVKVNLTYKKHKVWPRQPCCTG